jgi:hypothetical protein
MTRFGAEGEEPGAAEHEQADQAKELPVRNANHA